MSAIPSWFDITAVDAPTLRTFYAELLDWTVAVDAALDYGLVNEGEDPPVSGIGQAGEGNRHPAGVVTYFPVKNIDVAVSTAQDLGGPSQSSPGRSPGSVEWPSSPTRGQLHRADVSLTDPLWPFG